jgi:hypothetical protein
MLFGRSGSTSTAAVTTSMQSRVLECAAEIVGGTPQLCARLQVPEAQMRMWLDNVEVCPLPVFLQAVDIVLESERGFSAIFSKPPDGPAR